MKTPKIPDGYQQLMPYLIIKDALKFYDFVKNVFDAEEKYRVMRTGTTLMHGEISINGSMIMFADATDDYNEQTTGLFIYVNDCDTIYQKALDNGATTVTAPADQSYGRSAGVKDPFGITWWITSGM
jgi:PhnB protein